MTVRDDWMVRAGVIGPVCFIGAWVIGGLITTADYSPVDQAISRLAAIDSDVGWLMTAGFVIFGLSMQLFAVAVQERIGTSAAISISLTGLSTLGVALTPLDRSETVNQLHGVAASFGYLSLGIAPVLAWRSMSKTGSRAIANAGLVAAVVAASSLTLTLTDLPVGFFQRLGLTAVDLWIVATAIWFPPTRA